MTMLPSQPFEVKDFTGGLTDNFIQGQSSQYMAADNFILTTDGKLALRPGSKILDSTNYRLPDLAHGKVDFMGGWLTEDLVLAQSSQSLYMLKPNWTELLGPTSNFAFPLHLADNKISTGEWNRHYYLTPDSGTFPLKLYKDFAGIVQLRTAGLPQPQTLPTYTDAQLLTLGCSLANELKTKMLAHFNDYNDGVLVTWAHATQDVADIAQLNSAAAATDLPSLLTLITAIQTAYNTHITDAQLVNPNQVYHVNASAVASGDFLGVYPLLNLITDPNITLSNSIASAVAKLNDLRNRYNWHTWATATHVNAFNTIQTGFGAHATSFPTINNVQGPALGGANQIIINYINNVKAEFVAHLTDSVMHNNVDLHNLIQAPDCTDLWGAATILAHLEYFYWKHYEDANYIPDTGLPVNYVILQANTSIGSAQITAMSVDPNSFVSTGAAHPTYFVKRSTAAVANPYNWLVDDVFSPATNVHAVSIDSASQITVSAVAAEGLTTQTIVLSLAQYHYDLDRSTESVTTPLVGKANIDLLDFSLTNMQTFIDEAELLINRIKAHEISAGVSEAGPNVTLPPYLVYFPPTTFTGSQWMPHAINADFGFLFPEISGTVGIPYFDTPPLLVSYLYTLVWRYDYQIDSGTEFENVSTPSTEYSIFGAVSGALPPPLQAEAQFPISLGNLPVLVNDATTNYDTANIKLDIYRTVGDGDTFYLAGTVNNGTTSFVDLALDTFLIDAQKLYTTGGVSFNDQPPISKFMTILNTTGYFASIIDTGQTLENRVRQSNANSIDSCPATFFDDLDETITGMNTVKNNVVVFSRYSVYRMENGFNLLGQGALTHERISSTKGSLNNAGIVKTEDGLFFPGNDGFYFTDGFQLVKLSGGFDSYYAKFVQTANQRKRLTGTYDKIKNRIWWAVQNDPTGSAADGTYILHLNYGIKPMAVFTTASNSFYFRPTSLLFFNDQLYRGDERGYVFLHDDTVKNDPLVNTAAAATAWQTAYLPYYYASCAVDFGTTMMRKWVPKMSLTGKNMGNSAIQIVSDNDNGKNYYSLTPVRYTVNPMWGQPDVIWGTSSYRWKYDGQLDQWRRFVAGSMRCNFKQVTFAPSFSVVYASETYGNALVTVNSGAKTATILTPVALSNVIWPLDVVNYVIAFQSDGFVKEYAITALDVTTKIVTYSDVSNTSTSGTMQWVIRGYLKEAGFSLTTYVLHWSPLGLSMQAGFHSSDEGENT